MIKIICVCTEMPVSFANVRIPLPFPTAWTLNFWWPKCISFKIFKLACVHLEVSDDKEGAFFRAGMQCKVELTGAYGKSLVGKTSLRLDALSFLFNYSLPIQYLKARFISHSWISHISGTVNKLLDVRQWIHKLKYECVNLICSV